MKKIFMILAAISLLSLSLNAQVDIQTKAKPISKTRLASFNFNDVLRGIKGMESILSVSGSPNGQFRAPLRYDADLFNTLGPFTGDNFDYGIGFPEAYPEGPQEILVTTVLNRSEYEDHIGEKIVGLRFALWGDAAKTVKVSDFISYPFNSNSGFDQNHLYEWTLTDLEGNTPPSDDPGETTYQYVKISSTDDLASGQYLIVNEAQGAALDGSLGNSGTTSLTTTNNRTSVTISNSTIESNATTDAISFTYDATDGSLKSASGYYIGRQSGSSGGALEALTSPYANTITFSSGVVSVRCTSTNGNNTYYLRYNSSSNCFRYYTSSSQSAIALYKKVAVPSSKAPRRANRAVTLLTGWDYDTNGANFPSTWTVPSKGNGSVGGYYFGSSSGADIIIPSTDLQGATNVTVKLTAAKENTSSHSISVNNVASSPALTTSLVELTWDNVDASSGITIHVSDWYVNISKIEVYGEAADNNDGYVLLEPGQWHEFYLDAPVEFQVDNDDDQLFMGYVYKQYPLTSQDDEVMNPAAVNSESTGHDHYVNMIAGTAGAGDLVISLPGSTMNVASITVYDTNNNVLTSWNATTAYNNGDYTQVTIGSNNRISYNMPTGWSIASSNYFLAYSGDQTNFYGYLYGAGDITIAGSALNGNTTVKVVINGMDDNGGVTVSVNGDGKTIGTTQTNYTWNDVDLSATVYERSWYGIDFSEVGDLAVQLIFKTSEPTPVLTAPENGSTVNVGTNNGSGVSQTITVSGENLTEDLTVTLSGDGFSVSTTTISAADANAGTTITVTYNGTNPNATGTLTIGSGEVSTTVNLTASYEALIPVLITPENGSTVNVGTNHGNGASTTITVSGVNLTEDLTVSVSGTNFSVSPTTISAADANAGTATITITYDGNNPNTGTLTISSGEVSATVNLTADYDGSEEPTYSTTGMIRLGNLQIVDQFNESTAENAHPKAYKYVLRFVPEQGAAQESSPVDVTVEHTESIINGYYTAADVKADSTVYNTMKVDQMSADVKMTLSDNDNEIYYYRIQSAENRKPQEAAKPQQNFDMLAKLQQVSGEGGFFYVDMMLPSRPENPAGPYNYTDQTLTEDAVYGTSYKTYVPTIMTRGYDRRYFTEDSLHNTYGSPIWRTSIGKVDVISVKAEKQQAGNGSTYASWTDNGQECNLYMIDGLEAHGYLPSSNVSNVEYVPYLFRIYVASPTNMLRGFKFIKGTQDTPDHFEPDPDFNNYSGPWCIYEENVENAPVVDLDNGGRGVKWYLNKDVTNWENNARFGALSSLIQGTDNQNLEYDPENLDVFIRFYYMSTGNPQMVHPSSKGMLRSDDNKFYASEGSRDPQPSVGVKEIMYNCEVVSVTYVNPQGMQSSRPFDGVNIVVTRYSDGSTRTTKIIR